MQGATRGQAIIAISAVLLGLSWLFVSTRLYVRHFIIRKLSLDDFFLVLALVWQTTLSNGSSWANDDLRDFTHATWPSSASLAAYTYSIMVYLQAQRSPNSSPRSIEAHYTTTSRRTPTSLLQLSYALP